MKQKKFIFILSLGLSMGISALSTTSFAADVTAKKPATSKPAAAMQDHCDEHDSGMMNKMMESHMGGKMSEHDAAMMGDPMDGEMCDHEAAMMGGKMDGKMCDHEAGMMGDCMDGKMCDHQTGMMGGHMGGMMSGPASGMMGGHMSGMMGGHNSGMMLGSPQMNLLKSLDLSSEQRAKVNKLSDTLRHNNWASMGLIMDEAAKLRDLYGADKRDPSAIGKVYQKIFDIQRQIIETTIDTQNRVDEILTPAQRTQLKSLNRRVGPMRGYSMH